MTWWRRGRHARQAKGKDGKVHVKETKELTTGKGARRGAIIAGVFGLVYPPSLIASVVAGGGTGALASKLRDTGIKNDHLKKIADQLDAGKAAVIALAEDEYVPEVQNAMNNLGATLIVQPLSDEQLKQMLIATEEQA